MSGTLNILLMILVLIIPIVAQIGIMRSYGKYKKVENSRNLSGFEVARKVLDANGLQDVYVVETPGNLTDHYDPTRKVVKLSTDIFNGTTIAAASVAAHECGHAIQDKENYTFMRIRSSLVPVVNLVSNFSWIVIMIGFLAQSLNLFTLGIALIAIGLLFQLVTLPVEFNASSRAKAELNKLNLVGADEETGVAKMLSSAAMTYVASVLTSILEIVRLILVFASNNDE